MKPPYSINAELLTWITAVAEKLGAVNAQQLQFPRAELRKSNRIKTIQASLEIEGNTLSVDQITDLMNNKKIIGPAKDILEVKNAIHTYQKLETFKPYQLTSFLNAHKGLMKGLIPTAGKFRSKGAGILKGDQLTHLAPPANRVMPLMKELFDYLKKDPDPLLIKSCVFHYEMEFIHPFADGNGRMGRLWQTVILNQYNPVFAYLPVETLIKHKQREYYTALNRSDTAGESTPFLLFMLQTIDEALRELLAERRPPLTAEERLETYQRTNREKSFSRKAYLAEFKTLSTATASRDLKWAVDQKRLIKKGDKRLTEYWFA
jgi:Fic family protein